MFREKYPARSGVEEKREAGNKKILGRAGKQFTSPIRARDEERERDREIAWDDGAG